MVAPRTLIGAWLLCLGAASAWAAPFCQLQDVALQGTFPDLKPRAELSGAVMHGDFLLVVSNEAIGANEDHHAVQVFERTLDGAFRFVRDEIIFEADEDTCLYADFEGLALSGDHLYVVGSHSSSHKKQKAGNSYKKNRKALIELETDSCKSRNILLEFRIDGEARLTRPGRRIKTSAVLHDHPVLRAFAGLPSKENGVDIEGLAAKDGALYLGFRGPVLRENFVPIARIDPAGNDDPELSFVKLGGRGVRDMAATTDGFLILAGPNGDQDWSFELFHWDGRDMVTGTDRPQGGTVRHLCTIPHDPDGNPEGLAIVSRSATSADVILVYDSNARLIARRGSIPLQ
jgi:hypothetical protein